MNRYDQVLSNGTIDGPFNQEGHYIMTILVMDYDYNKVSKDISCWADEKGPVVEFMDQFLETASRHINLKWNATDDGVGIDHFEIYFQKSDYSLVLLQNTSQFSAEILLPSNSATVKGPNYDDYTIEIHSFDKIGNMLDDYIFIRYKGNNFFGNSISGLQTWQIIVGLLIIGIASIITLKVIRKKKKPLVLKRKV